MPPTPEDHPTPAPRKQEFGPMTGIIIILIILVFGAFYLLHTRLEEKSAAANQSPTIPSGTTTLPEITN